MSLDKAIASRAVFVVVSRSDGNAFESQLNNLKTVRDRPYVSMGSNGQASEWTHPDPRCRFAFFCILTGHGTQQVQNANDRNGASVKSRNIHGNILDFILGLILYFNSEIFVMAG